MNIRKLINFRLILTIALAVSLAPALGQTSIFVSPAGDDSNNGATWETAKATLAGALTAVSGATHIHMRVGSYSCQNVVIPNGVIVTGGYNAASVGTDTTQHLYIGENANWSNTSKCTILSGGNTSRVATINAGGMLEHCVVQEGKVTDKGGGLLIDGGTVMFCAIINNVALDYNSQAAKGGGVYIQNNGYLLNCVVAKNHANNGPGVAGTDGTLTNNTITANVAVANCGTVTDEDGNVYNTIMIGTQCWMAENLRVTRTPNGPTIPTGGSSSTDPQRDVPAGGASNVPLYGYLYNWPAVMNGAESSNNNPSGVQGICPNGWHVPSLAEWNQMSDYVYAQIPYRCVTNGSNTIGKALASTTGWSSSVNPCAVGNNQSTNNVTGFSAYPASNGSARYWTATIYNSYNAYHKELYYSSSGFDTSNNYSKSAKLSVRCVRD